MSEWLYYNELYSNNNTITKNVVADGLLFIHESCIILFSILKYYKNVSFSPNTPLSSRLATNIVDIILLIPARNFYLSIIVNGQSPYKHLSTHVFSYPDFYKLHAQNNYFKKITRVHGVFYSKKIIIHGIVCWGR